MCPLIYFLFKTSNLLYRPGNKVERSENKFGFSLKTLLCKLVFDHLIYLHNKYRNSRWSIP